jgi:myo-inositol-1(or 4)-monophosphatase
MGRSIKSTNFSRQTNREDDSPRAQVIDLLEILSIASGKASRCVRGYYSPYPWAHGTRNRKGLLQPTEKDATDPRTVVSRADLASEQIILSALRRELNCAFLSEEAGAFPGDTDTGFRVIIDSLDGSKNFLQGCNGLFGIAIGVERWGSLVAGAITLPYFGELLVAERGRGVQFSLLDHTRNQERPRPISRPRMMPATLARSRINIARGAADSKVLAEPPLSRVIKSANESVNYASSAVAFAAVALGRIDGLVLPRQRYWDFAAGAVIIKELGGEFEAWRDNWRTRVQGSELALATQESYYDVVAALHPALFREIKQHLQQPGKSETAK